MITSHVDHLDSQSPVSHGYDVPGIRSVSVDLLTRLGLDQPVEHRTDHSGWWLMISLVPIIGSIWLLVLLASSSDYGTNQYGPSPVHERAFG